VRTPEDEDRYISNFYASEGIRLDKDEIRPKAAKRGLAKLCLNSIWGKLTERNNRTKSMMISDPYELYSFLATICIEVTKLMFASDDVVWATWRFIEEEMIPNLRLKTEVIGAYVTAAACVHLYSFLDGLGERSFYYDTDSVLFVKPRDEPALVGTGDNLGGMSSELRLFEFIEEYVRGGPKN